MASMTRGQAGTQARRRLVLMGRPPLWVWPALAGFAVTAFLASRAAYFPADLWASHRIQELEAAPYEQALALASTLTEPPWVVLAVLVSVAVLAWRRLWGEALAVVLAQAIRALNALVKELVGRPRPSPALVEVRELPDTAAFPSGHVVSALVAYGLIFYLAGKLLPWPWARWGVRLLCLYVIAFTCMERLHSGAHWLSDVWGAALMTLPLLALAWQLVPRRRYF
jgi:membrane-associated phospholipid phosphatase